MNEQFQQVYDYLQSSGQLSEGTTQDSFYQKYSSSDSDFNKLYQRLSSREDLPFDLYDQEQFRADLFSVEGEAPLKKKLKKSLFSRSLLRFRLLRHLRQIREHYSQIGALSIITGTS